MSGIAPKAGSLHGKRGLVAGIANASSIAAGCARAPGPSRTRAASGIDRFDELLAAAAAEAPERHLADVDDVGALAAFLVGDGALHITETVIPVDGGQHLV